ncbi:hypothetical protein D3C80_1508440 [compost metagenome]
MQMAEGMPAQSLQLAQHQSVQHRQAVENTARQRRRRLRRRHSLLHTGLADLLHHRCRVDKTRMVGIDQSTANRLRRCLFDQLAQVGDIQFLAHPLQQPQAHDVFQHPIPPFRAALVGHIGRQRCRTGVGMLTLKTHQRPGTGAEIGGVFTP